MRAMTMTAGRWPELEVDIEFNGSVGTATVRLDDDKVYQKMCASCEADRRAEYVASFRIVPLPPSFPSINDAGDTVEIARKNG